MGVIRDMQKAAVSEIGLVSDKPTTVGPVGCPTACLAVVSRADTKRAAYLAMDRADLGNCVENLVGRRVTTKRG